jgi:hypothetical protein
MAILGSSGGAVVPYFGVILGARFVVGFSVVRHYEVLSVYA